MRQENQKHGWKPSSYLIHLISKSFPTVSSDWLTTGKLVYLCHLQQLPSYCAMVRGWAVLKQDWPSSSGAPIYISLLMSSMHIIKQVTTTYKIRKLHNWQFSGKRKWPLFWSKAKNHWKNDSRKQHIWIDILNQTEHRTFLFLCYNFE